MSSRASSRLAAVRGVGSGPKRIRTQADPGYEPKRFWDPNADGSRPKRILTQSDLDTMGSESSGIQDPTPSALGQQRPQISCPRPRHEATPRGHATRPRHEAMPRGHATRPCQLEPSLLIASSRSHPAPESRSRYQSQSPSRQDRTADPSPDPNLDPDPDPDP
jgi:hypothetical protein